MHPDNEGKGKNFDKKKEKKKKIRVIKHHFFYDELFYKITIETMKFEIKRRGYLEGRVMRIFYPTG